jgi:hypothetical protein
VFVPEPVTAAQNASSYAFIDAVSNTQPFHTMWNFLKANGFFSRSKEQIISVKLIAALASSAFSVFREQLHTLWFGLYSRGGKGDLGSSGKERLFTVQALARISQKITVGIRIAAG